VRLESPSDLVPCGNHPAVDEFHRAGDTSDRLGRRRGLGLPRSQDRIVKRISLHAQTDAMPFARAVNQKSFGPERPIHLMSPIENFCAVSATPSGILGPLMRYLTAADHRAKISLQVFLRLTRMDVCCGPPIPV
jgi:hypothetical protein